jgi:hypothetical protein
MVPDPVFLHGARWFAGSDPLPADCDTPLRIGLFGAGRTRNGLGPFLASAAASAGGRVVGVAGRGPQSAAAAAAALAERLGHPVDAYATAELLARAVDVLFVATPAPAHGEGLAAALAAGVPCLCEKPLVPAEAGEAGRRWIEAFAARDLLLVENCQWPAVLPALFALFPQLANQPVQTVAMGMGPPERGLPLVADALSHLLSVVQALAPVVAGPLQDLEVANRSPDAEHNLVRCTVPTMAGPLRAELHVTYCPSQPRPAWLSVNGCRIDRRIGPGYTLQFAAGERLQAVADPMHQLVYGVLNLCRYPDLERTRALHREIRCRLDWYEAILAACGC